jgi:glutaryl-CoA dehydrogenase
LGVFGANLPEKYGCAGVSNVAYGLITQELEAGDSGVRSFASVQGALSMYPIYQFGTEEQRLELAAADGRRQGDRLFRTDRGRTPAPIRAASWTTARKVAGGWLLNGSKAWITNGSIADVAIVWAKTDDGTIRGFLVEKGTPGFSAPEVHHKLSLRASVTAELFFQDCLIPEENLLPGTKGLKSPLMCLTQARYGIAWGGIGAARDCYQTALEYAKQRVQFDRPIAVFPAHPGEAGPDDHRDHQGSAARPPAGTAEGRRA